MLNSSMFVIIVASILDSKLLLKHSRMVKKLAYNYAVNGLFRFKCTYYEVLDVPRTASDKEIKASFYKKSMKVHPDKQLETSSTDQFVKIKTAYEILGHNQSRIQYDEYLVSLDKGKYSFQEWKLQRNVSHRTVSDKDKYKTTHDFDQHQGVETTWSDFGLTDLMLLIACFGLVGYIVYDQKKIVRERADERPFGSVMRSFTSARQSLQLSFATKPSDAKGTEVKKQSHSSQKDKSQDDVARTSNKIVFDESLHTNDVFEEIKSSGFVSDKSLKVISEKYKQPLDNSSLADRIKSW